MIPSDMRNTLFDGWAGFQEWKRKQRVARTREIVLPAWADITDLDRLKRQACEP